MRHLFILLFLLTTLTVRSQITGIKIVGDTCTSFTLDLQALGTSSSPYFFWDFDDVASGVNDTITITGASASPFPTHTFSSAGVYTVCVSFQEPGFPVSTICRTINIGLCCNGIITSSDTCLQNSIPFSITTGASITSIVWDFNDPSSGANTSSTSLTPSHVFSSSGNYSITATVNATCGTFLLNYPLQIVNCSSSCSGSIESNDTCASNASSFQLVSSNSINAIEWNFGDASSGSSNTSTAFVPNHLFSSTGTYTIRAIVEFDCGFDTLFKTITIINCDSINEACDLFVPNAFSPNTDGINDIFYPSTICPFEHYELLIFNRWGELVFKTSTQAEQWDGKFNGLNCPDGVYEYLITYKFLSQQTKSVCGCVTLIR